MMTSPHGNPVDTSQSSPGTSDMVLQRETHNGMDGGFGIRADPNVINMSLYQKIKDSSELLNSEKDFRESRPDEELPQVNAT